MVAFAVHGFSFWGVREGAKPRLPQLHVSYPMIFAKGYGEVAAGIEGAAIETDVLLQGLEDKVPFIGGWFSFSRHLCESASVVELGHEVDALFGTTSIWIVGLKALPL